MGMHVGNSAAIIQIIICGVFISHADRFIPETLHEEGYEGR